MGGAWLVLQNARKTGGGFDPPPWFRMVAWLLLVLAAILLAQMVGMIVMGCSGPAFEPGTVEGSSPVAISPASDGGLSEDPLAGSDGAHSPGLDAGDAGELGGGDAQPDTPSALDSSPPLLDHTADPWPVDVVVEPMPAPNCFVDFAGHDSCCRAVNQPPVKCEAAQSPHFCVSCPP